MNRPAHIPTEVWIECFDCDGRGFTYGTYRVAGEPYGGFTETRCETCWGRGGEFEEQAA